MFYTRRQATLGGSLRTPFLQNGLIVTLGETKPAQYDAHKIFADVFSWILI